MREDAADYQVRAISREYNWDMLRVLSDSPIETPALDVVFDRRPDIFAVPRLFSDRIDCAGFFDGNRLVGFAMLLRQTRLVNGEPRPVFYFGGAHVRQEARNRGFLYRTGRFLARGTRGEAELGYAVVMAENSAARKFIGARRPDYPDLPHSKNVAVFRAKSVLVAGPRKEDRKYRVRRAGPDDVEAMVALLRAEYRDRLFAPVVDRDSFIESLARRPGCGMDRHYVVVRNGEIVGTCAAWDAGSLKQTRILRLGRKLRWLRAAHSAAADLLGFAPMPRLGMPTRDVTVCDCAARGRDPRVLRALLAAVHNECARRRYNLMIVGACHGDPLFEAVRGFPGPSTFSTVALFAWDPALLEEGRIDASLPFIDPVML
ncbi:MAG: hypothetical protein JW747_10710 [Candidatus Aminicenantes bacterium]|nr:hypothetical protein [Candidatus Aminicenantes bacterium]